MLEADFRATYWGRFDFVSVSSSPADSVIDPRTNLSCPQSYRQALCVVYGGYFPRANNVTFFSVKASTCICRSKWINTNQTSSCILLKWFLILWAKVQICRTYFQIISATANCHFVMGFHTLFFIFLFRNLDSRFRSNYNQWQWSPMSYLDIGWLDNWWVCPFADPLILNLDHFNTMSIRSRSLTYCPRSPSAKYSLGVNFATNWSIGLFSKVFLLFAIGA